MWDGWTVAERNDILKEVYLDRHGMVAFHKKVLNSQFFWWSLVPVLGCATASMRWKAMKKSKRKYGLWAHCSHMALTKTSVIVVGIPSEDRLHLPAEDWPRECIRLQNIADVHIDIQPSRVCCVPNTVKTVRLKLTDRSDRMQLVGMLDPKQFIEDLLSIQAGNWPLAPNKRLSIDQDPEESETAPLIDPGTHTNPLFDPASVQDVPAESSVCFCLIIVQKGGPTKESSLADNLHTQMETPNTVPGAAASKTKPGKVFTEENVSTSQSVRPSTEISAFHGLDGEPFYHAESSQPVDDDQISNEADEGGVQPADRPAKASVAHAKGAACEDTDNGAVKNKDKKKVAEPVRSKAEDEDEENVEGTWCWELDSLDEAVEGWQPATYDEVHRMKHPPDLAALVEETRGCKTKCGIDLDKDVQPYDSDDSGVCQLASETAEWWGPEWGSDEDDPDVTRMTTREAEAVLLGCRLPPPTEDEIARVPGAEETWKKYPRCKPKARAVSEARLKAALEVEEALSDAFTEARKVKTHPLVSDQVPMILHVLSDIRNTIQQVVEDAGGTKRNSRRFSSRLSLDPQEVLSRYTRAL